MRHLRTLLLSDAAVIPRSFELFYAATVMRTLATALRMTAEREIAHHATQHAYTAILTQWRDRQSQPLPENARYVLALATQTATGLYHHQDTSTTSYRTVDGDREQQPDDEFELLWFDIRDGLRELALNATTPWPPRPSAPFSALVADSNPWLRAEIAAWLTQKGATTVHEAATVAEAQAHALASGPRDLAILDLEQLDGSGIELVTDLRNHGWHRIVVLLSPNHSHIVPLAIQAGAQACLLKPASPTTDSTPYNLSTREIEILQLVAAGNSNREIGQTLHLATSTIKSHLVRIGRKLGADSRARMVVHAMRASIIN